MIEFVKNMLRGNSDVSSKRCGFWLIIGVLCVGLFTNKAELCADWLGSIALFCVGGNVIEKFKPTNNGKE